MQHPNSQETQEKPNASVLDGFLTEREYAAQRGVTVRTCERDRAMRQSPPYTLIGRKVYYRIEAVRDWLLKREKDCTREPQSFARRGAR